jgi:hypothetical protein
MSRSTQPLQVIFDPTPEIFATDASGAFFFPLLADGGAGVATAEFDEARFTLSLWYPSNQRLIDLDRAYVEIQGSFSSRDEHWIKLAEVEPVVPPYEAGRTFDGWIVLPILAAASTYALAGGGFDPRARLQVRVSGYFVP